jgi:hypothetical protein
MRTKFPPSGFILQLYRGASGFSFDKLVANIDRYKACGVTGIAPHGFEGDLDVKKFDKYAQLAKSKGMNCYAAFGLGPSKAYDRGAWIGKVAQHPDCAGVLFDLEGAFEIAVGKKAAADIGEGFISQFPNGVVDVWTCDQPWASPGFHWTRFPWEEIARYVDARAAQFYFNDWKGKSRYDTLNPRFHHEWDVLNARLRRSRLERPLMMTFQAYGWSDIFPDFIDALLANPTSFFWCDKGLPNENALLGMRVVTELAKLGHTGPTAVKDFQKAWNAAHPKEQDIAEDGRCGYGETIPALGIEVTDEMKTG